MELEIKSYREYCWEWVKGCSTSYSRVEWKSLSEDVWEGLKSLLILLLCVFVPLLVIFFPLGGIILRKWDE